MWWVVHCGCSGWFTVGVVSGLLWVWWVVYCRCGECFIVGVVGVLL